MSNEKSDTPRTEKLLLEINEGRAYITVGPIAELCRELERELAAVKKAARELFLFNHNSDINGCNCGYCQALRDLERLVKE